MRTASTIRRGRPLHALLAAVALVLPGFGPAPALAAGVRLFRDGTGLGFWDLSWGASSGGSTVELANGSKFPVDDATRWRGTSALRLRFTPAAGGDWVLGVANAGWAPFDATALDTVVWWAWSATALDAAQLPDMLLEDQSNVRTPRQPLSIYNPGGLPAATWTRLVMPLAPFRLVPGSANLSLANKVFFCQSATGAAGVQRTLFLDELRVVDDDPTPPPAPLAARATGYERHAEVQWDAPDPAEGVESHRIERLVGGAWTAAAWADAAEGGGVLWLGAPGVGCTLRVVAEDWSFRESAPSPALETATRPLADDEFLDMIQRATFRTFWDAAHPVSGLTRERSGSGDVCAAGGTGFGLMAIPVGVERGFVTRAAGAARVLKVLSFLATTAERHWGAFPHWIHGATGQHVPFLGPSDDRVDLVETAYLAQALLAVRAYFDGAGAEEAQIRALATQLWEAIEWDQFRPGGDTSLWWHRSPTTGFTGSIRVEGWHEGMITYLLAVASPTHPVPASLYTTGWARNGAMANPNSYYGHRIYVGPAYGGPLFFAHYSFVGLDPRFKRDAWANYYTHNRNHALVHVAYAVANPLGRAGYGASAWGLTASDDPAGYGVHAPYNNDNGTLAPTAALASMPYAPHEALAAARHFYDAYGAALWSWHGFRDAFNPGAAWTAPGWIAIDQGPILLMIENHRSGLLWNRFMSNPEIAPALAAVGFVADSSSTVDAPAGAPAPAALALAAGPNPSSGPVTFALALPGAEAVAVEVFDLAGRRVAVPWRGALGAGRHAIRWDGRCERGALLPPGVYLARARTASDAVTARIVRVR
uniref:Glycoamylase-like domain-containing protein n=1 Tax=Eiseniibacteriota bacterium TaxID=2212470 RepID=A0A832MLJ8_UNCEI